MRISIQLDREDGPLDPAGVLGDILIEDTRGQRLFENVTFVDSWAFGLVEAVERLHAGDQRFEIDLDEEPRKIVFARRGESVLIQYKGVVVVAGCVKELGDGIADLAKQLLDETDKVHEEFLGLRSDMLGFLTRWKTQSERDDVPAQPR